MEFSSTLPATTLSTTTTSIILTTLVLAARFTATTGTQPKHLAQISSAVRILAATSGQNRMARELARPAWIQTAMEYAI